MRRICPVCLEELDSSAEQCPLHGEGPDALVGSVIDGRYRVARRWSVGRGGAVYEAVDIKLARHLILKAIIAPSDGEAAWRDRVLTRVRTLAGLDHPNIVAVHDYADIEEPRRLCVVMERLRGRSVAYEIDRCGPFDLRIAARVTLQAAYALGAAHARDLRHEDVTTDNVFLLRRADQDDFVKLLNFASPTPIGEAVGALDYASPELVTTGVADDRSDIYALAMVTYAMVCGRPAFPFRERTDAVQAPPRPRELRPELPPAAEEILLTALKADPADRPVAVEVFAKTFSRALLDTTAAVRAFSDEDAEETLGVPISPQLQGVSLAPAPLPPATEDLEPTAQGIVIPASLASIVLEGE